MIETTEENIVERVQAGVALLDNRLPDWRAKVIVDKIDMSRYETCVLGQYVGGDLSDALALEKELQIKGYTGLFGFCGPDALYPQLNELWKAEVSKRAGEAE